MLAHLIMDVGSKTSAGISLIIYGWHNPDHFDLILQAVSNLLGPHSISVYNKAGKGKYLYVNMLGMDLIRLHALIYIHPALHYRTNKLLASNLPSTYISEELVGRITFYYGKFTYEQIISKTVDTSKMDIIL
jgi:hypothetical protein